MKNKPKTEDEKKERPSLHHAAYASCTCGWNACVSAADQNDLYVNAVPAVNRKAKFHPCPSDRQVTQGAR